MTYKYRPTYNRETQAYAYLDFDFEFRMHTPAQNAHKFLCKLIEEHVWLRIPLPTPRENKGKLVTVEITWSLARCMHEVYWKISDASECTGCCKVRSVG